jgi:hypothetical protein
VIGTLQATEAIKVYLKRDLTNSLLIYDGFAMNFES